MPTKHTCILNLRLTDKIGLNRALHLEITIVAACKVLRNNTIKGSCVISNVSPGEWRRQKPIGRLAAKVGWLCLKVCSQLTLF